MQLKNNIKNIFLQKYFQNWIILSRDFVLWQTEIFCHCRSLLCLVRKQWMRISIDDTVVFINQHKMLAQ